MNTNLKKIFLAFAFFPFITSLWQGVIYGSFDYGDAPDGARAYPEVIGKFPSKRLSNGARVKFVNEVWLGERADKETESRQVDLDKADDGVALSNMKACAKASTQFFVHIRNPKNTKNLGQGKAYLNLFMDWNKSGEWSGNDGCADEWAIKNYEVDLTKQTSAIAVYVPEFIAGKNVQDLWYRATVVLDEKFQKETGVGSFKSGEIEDYGPSILIPAEKEPKIHAFCSPNPLVVEHGGSANFIVIPAIGSIPIASVELAKSAQANKDREIELDVSSPAPHTFSYISKAKDGPTRVESDMITLSVTHSDSNGNKISYGLNCPVLIKHTAEGIIIDGPLKKIPPPLTKPKVIETKSPANPKSGVSTKTPLSKFPSFETKFQKYVTDGITQISVVVTPKSLEGRIVNGIELTLAARGYTLPGVSRAILDINNSGWSKNDWQCKITGASVLCSGSLAIEEGKHSVLGLDFNSSIDNPPEFLNAKLLAPDGSTIAGIGIPYLSTE